MMTTVTLVQAADHAANHIHLMTARPMNVSLTGLSGGAIQFGCTNPLASIRGATTVDIVFDASVGGRHQTIQISSVQQ